MNDARIYLIGAGPGDPGLMTVHGLECLRAADVVVVPVAHPPRAADRAAPVAGPTSFSSLRTI